MSDFLTHAARACMCGVCLLMLIAEVQPLVESTGA